MDERWNSPDPWAVSIQRLKYSLLAMSGLTEYAPLAFTLQVGTPQDCQAAESIDWCVAWTRSLAAAETAVHRWGSRHRTPSDLSSSADVIGKRAVSLRCPADGHLRSLHNLPFWGSLCERMIWSGLPVRPISPAAAPRKAADMLWKDPIRAYSIISTISMRTVHATHLGK